jgi:hypothetical protein
MNAIQLTPAQHAILAKAINASGGKIEWFPDHIKGGARQKVLDSMCKRALITPDGQSWRVATQGYGALGMAHPAPDDKPVSSFEAELDQVISAAEAAWKQPPQAAPRSRAGSKQAEVVLMLRRPEGATIGQICAATGWQNHTVRGFFAGALKKKLGLPLTSDKQPGGERVYRVA